MFSTNFTNEVEYLQFKDEFRRTLIYIAIAFVVGFLLGIGDGIFLGFFIGIVAAGFPLPWRFMPNAMGFWGLCIKITLCILFGLIVTPIGLIFYFYQIKKYENRLKNKDMSETQYESNQNIDTDVESMEKNS